ncbi:versican core protein-like isoform X1 [Hoplias malabaricus]|uniref:versican core protein-like isoform X1 n=2 Tax=Hoplias malabaricus TaxID=27720 RepID=UPI003462EA08
MASQNMKFIPWPITTVFIIIVAYSQSSQPQINFKGRTGSSAILSCNFSTELLSEYPHVEWRRYYGIVFEKSDEGLYQAEEYKDRIDVPEDKLLNGDCSLVINNIKPEDAGVYEAFLVVKQESPPQSKRVFLQRVEDGDDSPERELDPKEPKDERKANESIHVIFI